MNPNAPIGVFDSGLGGLTVVKALFERLPHESLIYFGDTAHLPYGDKSPELIRAYSRQITQFLLDSGAKAIVIACNTASAVAKEAVLELTGRIPVIDVIIPATQLALDVGFTDSIGVIGTKATIRSQIYTRTIRENAPSCRVVEKATPLLVPLIEEGWHNNSFSREVIEAYMSDTGFADIQALILGCTHYPLIRPQIEAYFSLNQQSIQVIDPSEAVAETVFKRLHHQNALHLEGDALEHKFFVSDFSQSFASAADMFLDRTITFQKLALKRS